jgi:hypothetical protein
MLRHSAVIGFLVALAGTAMCVSAQAQRQRPQWSVAFDNENGQFAASIVVGTSAANSGITVSLLRSAANLSPNGVRRWRVGATNICPPGATNAYVDAVEILPNGESWVLRTCSAPGGLIQRRELARLAPDGSVLVTANLDTIRPSWYSLLIAQPDGVIALVPENNGLRWLRVGSDGAVIGEAFTDLVGPDHTVTITNARTWPNGSASVATWQHFANCNISPPTACPRPATTLLRLNADGSERWRVEAGEVLAFIGFDDDGSSLIAESRNTVPLRLRQVSATGVPGTAFVAAGGEPIYLSGAAGPVRGRYLAYSETEHLLIDRNGTVLARRNGADGAGGAAMANGEMGFITGAWRSDGALISADDLSVLAEFDVDGIDNVHWSSPGDQFWNLLDDGSLYTNSRAQVDTLPPQRARISRFAVPGSPAADIIFISRFD